MRYWQLRLARREDRNARLETLNPNVLRAGSPCDDARADHGIVAFRARSGVQRRLPYTRSAVRRAQAGRANERRGDSRGECNEQQHDCGRRPTPAASQRQLGVFRQPPDSDAVRAEAQAAVAGNDLDRAMRGLRRLREREMGRIAVRDLGGCPLDETLGALSDLADACVSAAVDAAWRDLEQRFGCVYDAQGAPVGATVLGMGKLGGRELNFSSDIDLIFVHGGDGESDGARPLAAEAWFARLAQGVQRLLSQHTADGFVFRVDTLLRPFGSAGPVSVGLDAAERYYRQHGREWERYAMIKARPVGGDLALGRTLIERLQPFVYRRYVDYNALLALRKLKRMIAEDVERKGHVDDVKLGRGGIRELEFIVQSFQLMRGGQVVTLRGTRLRPVLESLADEGLMATGLTRELDDAYVFLRRLENAIQMYDDRQAHQLPVDEDARAALCAALRQPDWATLDAAYRAVADRVHAAFSDIFAAAPSGGRGVSELDWDPDAGRDELVEIFRGAGFHARPDEIADALVQLRRSRPRSTLLEDSVLRLRRVLRQMLALCLERDAPDEVALRVLKVLQSIVGRSTYLTLLHESEIARRQLSRLCAASPWVSQQIAATPQVLDRLLDPATLYRPPSRVEMREQLDQRVDPVPLDDVEAGMDALRRVRQAFSLRIAASEIGGALSVARVSDHLSWLAEAVVEKALQRASAGLRVTHGQALRRDGQPAGFICVAYGKFGGAELGYGSDLDLVFIHDCDAPESETTGPRAIGASVLMTRVGQRLIHWLSTLTPAGRAYEVDTELRPSGRSGLPVVSLAGFTTYQQAQAWTWEHQALTRARPVAGSDALARAFEALRRTVLCAPRDPVRLRDDVLSMRDKMQSNLDRSDATRWDVKQGRGGLIDIEFITQYLLLREAAGHPQVIEHTDNWRQLDALCDAGVIEVSTRDELLAIYRSYRAYAHTCSLAARAVHAAPDGVREERAAVQRIWRQVFDAER